jgi:hypothetical protein
MERAHAAAVSDAAGFVDDVETLGPRGIGVVSGVVDVVDSESNWVVEPLDEIVGNGHALSEGLRLGVTDVLFHVGFHLPFVGRVSFADVHRQEIGVIFIVVVNLHHVTDVAAEGRSSVAAEDDDQRAGAGSFANVEVIGTVESDQPRVGSVVADFERAAVHMGQGIADHAVGIFGAACHLAEKEERGEQKQQESGNGAFPKESHC